MNRKSDDNRVQVVAMFGERNMAAFVPSMIDKVVTLMGDPFQTSKFQVWVGGIDPVAHGFIKPRPQARVLDVEGQKWLRDKLLQEPEWLFWVSGAQWSDARPLVYGRFSPSLQDEGATPTMHLVFDLSGVDVRACRPILRQLLPPSQCRYALEGCLDEFGDDLEDVISRPSKYEHGAGRRAILDPGPRVRGIFPENAIARRYLPHHRLQTKPLAYWRVVNHRDTVIMWTEWDCDIFAVRRELEVVLSDLLPSSGP